MKFNDREMLVRLTEALNLAEIQERDALAVLKKSEWEGFSMALFAFATLICAIMICISVTHGEWGYVLTSLPIYLLGVYAKAQHNRLDKAVDQARVQVVHARTMLQLARVAAQTTTPDEPMSRESDAKSPQ